MRLTDRSVFSELLTPFFIGLLAFLMMLVGNTLFQLLDTMMQEGWPIGHVARVLVFNIPTVLVRTLPIAGVVGASLATARLARDNEVTALRAAGISLRRVFAPVIALGLALSVADFYLFDRVVPWAWREQNNVEDILASLPQNPIESTATISVDNYIFGFSRFVRNPKQVGAFTVYDVTVLERATTEDAPPRVSIARVGEYTPGTFVLRDATLQELSGDGTTRMTLKAKKQTIAVRLDRSSNFFRTPAEQLENLPIVELARNEREMRALKDIRHATDYAVARWYKIGLPLLCFPLALFSVPLSLRFSRAGSFAGLLLSLSVIFLSVLSLAVAQVAARSNLLPAPIALLLPSVVFSIAALVMLRRME